MINFIPDPCKTQTDPGTLCMQAIAVRISAMSMSLIDQLGENMHVCMHVTPLIKPTLFSQLELHKCG